MRPLYLLLASCLALSSCTGGGDGFVDAMPDLDSAPVDGGVVQATLTVTHSGNSDGVVTSAPTGVECGATCTLTVPVGTTVTLTASPDDHTDFTGWSGAGCTGVEPCEVVVTEDVTVDAAFELQRFTVDVDNTGTGFGAVSSAPAGIDCGADCTEDYDFGTAVTLTATPDVGTTFLGWTGAGCTGTGPCVVDVQDDVLVQATFGLDHSLNVVKAGNGTGLVTSLPAGIDCGLDCDEVYTVGTVVTLTGGATGDSFFEGFSGGGCLGVAPCTVTVDDALAVTATFTLHRYTLDVDVAGTGAGEVTSSPGGIDCGTDCTEDYDSGQDVVLTPTPSAGRFAGWIGGGCTDLGPCTVDVTDDVAVTATFDLITVTDVNSSFANGVYPAGTTITIQVTFSDPVVVTGTPTLTLTSGGVATYSGGSGTNVLTFTYVVTAGQNSGDLDYPSTGALALAGGTIGDALGNAATLTLPTPGTPTSLGGHKAIIIDTTAPTVSGVTATNANGTYSIGAVITIQVGFSENVVVTGTPTLTVSSGAPAVAYAGGSGTSTLTFAYTVAAGQNSADLDAASTGALALNGGTIRDAATNNATLTVPVGAAAGALALAKNLVIDTAVPTVTNVTSSTTNGTYGTGAVISIQVTFSEAAVVTGAPTLALDTGGSATYASGTGTTTLTFTHTVVAGQNTADLDYASTGALALAGGTIRDGATNNATLTLPAVGGAGSLGANKALVIDTAGPTVSGVTSSTTNGSYGLGASISIQVTFTEAVTVTGTPTLALNTGGSASYTSGSGGATLTFTYTVGASQNTGDLDYAATGSLAGGTIRDAVNNNATLTLVAPGASGSLGFAKALVIDTVVPTVTGVTSSTPNGTYGVGDAISIQVGFSEPVNVTGVPTLVLNTGATVNYASGTGTATLTFTYTVGASQNTVDLDYGSTLALGLGAATIRDAALNNAGLTLVAPGASGSLGFAKALVIDTAGPTISGVTSSTTNGSYGAGSVISIQVTFTEAVTVTGTPTLALNTSTTAGYTGGSGTTVLTFTYTVAAGQNTADLDYAATTSLTGTIRDAADNNASLTLFAPGASGSLGFAKALVIDTTVPTVTGVTSSTANGSYGATAAISIQVTFSENVVVTGTPLLALNTGVSASYASGSGTSSLTFGYTVAAGQNVADLDYVATTSLTAGTIADAAANAATRTLAAPAASGSLGFAKNLVIDTIAPTVTGVTSSTTDGSYKAAASISIQVSFSEVVNVTGTPALALNTAGSASYSGGSGTTALTFTYTVGAGQNTADLDYAATTSLTAGTIADAAANAATRTLATPGASGSLGFAKNLVIDTTAPTVTGVSSSTTNGSYNTGDAISIQVTFSENVFVTGSPALALNTGGSATYGSGSGTAILTFGYTVLAGHNTADLDYAATTSLTGGTIRDLATNDATRTLAAPAASGSLGASKNLVIDTSGPIVTNVTSPATNGTYGAGAGISIQVVFGETVTVTGTPTLALNTGATASYTGGSGSATLTFGYTVASPQNIADLDYAATTSLSGTIADGAGNAATLTLAAPGAATSLGFNKNLAIDTSGPIVTNVTSSTGDGSYGAGQVISIQVGFSEAVAVTGTPTLAVNTGASVSYAGGTGTSTLTFNYTVGASHNSADLDYTTTGSLSGTIADGAGNAASLTLPAVAGVGSLGFNKNLRIDTVAPTVTNVTSSNANGTYGTGQLITITVAFSEAVNVVNVPLLALNTGVSATYASGTGTSTLSFAYTVGAGQSTSDLNYTSTGALTLNGGLIRDAALNSATLTLPATTAPGSLGVNKNIAIDTAGPVVTNVTSPDADGTYRTGQVKIYVTFNEAVSASGPLTLTLNTGGVATYIDGSGTNTLGFTYVLVNGHNTPDLDEASTGALALNGGTIKDVASNNAVLTLPAPQAAGSLGANKRIIIDTGPVVINVTSTETDATYGVGAQIMIVVTFNENISISGLPFMTLDSGGIAVRTDSAGPNMYMNYTIAAGHSSPDLDYLNTASLVANGTIRDVFGTDATLTLFTPDTAGSLGFNKNIVIVDGITRYTAGTNEWPDSACNPTTTFGTCSTNDPAYATAWTTRECQHHGYANGAWTGLKFGGCAGAESVYCADSGATCASPIYERSCQSSDQTQLYITCYGGFQARWDKGWGTPGITYSNNDRTIAQGSTGTTSVRATVGRSTGKYYWEIKVEAGNANVNAGGLGIVASDWPNTASYVGSQASSFGFGYGPANTQWWYTWNQLVPVLAPPAGSAINAGNIYMFAVDLDANRLWIGMNGVWFNNGNPAGGVGAAATGIEGLVYPAVTFYGSSANVFTANFGDASFAYAVPFGFKAGWF